MDTVKIADKKNARLVAHRGGNLELENTIGSFVAGSNRSYFGIETDIHVTADGRFVVFHDDNTGRLCVEDLIVEHTDYETLRNLKFKPYNSRTQRQDIKIPSLEEYIDVCKNYEKTCVLEFKNTFKRENVFKACEIIKASGYSDNFVYITWYMKNIEAIREFFPDAKIQILLDVNPENFKERLEQFCVYTDSYEGKTEMQKLLSFLKENRLDADVFEKYVTKEFIDSCHALGIKVNVWTIDDPEVAQKFIDMGVDFVTTNCLE